MDEQFPARERCPACGQPTGLPISFGMPSSPDDGDYYYVRCCTVLLHGINMPCTVCNHKWHSPAAGDVQ